MKIIISHDVDHIYWNDHLVDTFIPGLILRSSKQVANGEIPFKEALNRFDFFNELNKLDSVCEKLKGYNIPATFFFGMRKGLNLSYSPKTAKKIIDNLIKSGFEVGLHGMDYQYSDNMLEEKQNMEEISQREIKGIRNHYLRNDSNTFKIMDSLGYDYDSTDYGIKHPYKIKDMWEIPISIMDVTLLKDAKSNLLTDLKEYTVDRIKYAKTTKIPFFVINFHDVYYSLGYMNLKNWFDWVLEFLVKEKYQFVNFDDAVKELNKGEK